MLTLEKLAVQTVRKTDVLVGTVKWFDSTRGFGFVLSEGFASEFLLPGNILAQFGVETLPDGSNIEFLPESSANGLRVKEVLSAEKKEPTFVLEEQDEQVVVSESCIPARVKWFNDAEGYGFVNCFGCVEDVFVGSGVVRRAGFTQLMPGQALSIKIAQAADGKRVHQIHDWSAILSD